MKLLIRKSFILIACLVLSSLLCISQSNTGCYDSSFRKIYYTLSDTVITRDQVNAFDNGTFLIGGYTPVGTAVSEGNIIRLDDTGRINWTVQIKAQTGESIILERGVECADHSLLATGTISSLGGNSRIFLARISAAGSLVWQRHYAVSSNYIQHDELFLSGIEEEPNKEILLACNVVSGQFGNAIAVLKLNASGKILWQQLFVPGAANSHLEIAGIHFSGNPVITGYSTESDNLCSFDQRSVFVAVLDRATGDVIQQKNHCFSQPPAPYPFTDGIYRFNSQLLSNGQIVLSGPLLEGTTLSNKSKRTFLTVRFSSDLTVLSSRIVETNFNINHNGNRITARPNGDIMISILRPSTGLYFALIDTFSSSRKQRKLPLPNYAYPFNVLANTNYSRILSSKKTNTTFANTYFKNGGTALEFFKLADDAGNEISCSGEDTAFAHLTEFPLLNGTRSWKQSVRDFFVENTKSVNLEALPFLTDEICSRVTSCDNIQIIGNDTVCVPGQEENYVARRNPGCYKAIQWKLDSSYVSSWAILNDSMIRVKFKMPAPGSQSVTISASLLGCTIKTDSFQIMLHQVLQLKSSGNEVCPGQSIRISAGHWFKEYLWQDGSTDSVFIADKPGKYYVRVKAYCGYTMSDTIIIGGFAPGYRFLEGDSLRCNGDTIRLKTPGGFSNYLWSPSIELIKENDSTVLVFPTNQRQYRVQMEIFLGCWVIDSINITPASSPPLQLISDTSICSNDTLLLRAADGFVSYHWSTGESTPFIRVTSARVYTVEAFYVNGCASRDTFILNNVFISPKPRLNKNNILCYGQSDSLDAGNYSSYKWSNQATSRSIRVSYPGKYWVEVMDNNGCKGKDSVFITSVVNPPSEFLPPDTTICLLQPTIIKPISSFEKYLWSDGSSGSWISVDKKGHYTLEVRDKDGCIGKDSINIKEKQCSNKIYFPNAFSPDGDGKNDQFKPIVQGQLSHYELSVFNRWGQLVFKSNSPALGWNGFVGGTLQPTGGYVWTCRYSFISENSQVIQGTLLLIR